MSRGGSQHTMKMDSVGHGDSTPHVPFSDERLGRLHAEALKLSSTGTLGLLLRAKAEGRIPRIEPSLEHLGRLGFRLSAKTHAAVLRQAGE
jgi:predicted nucleic acid-binding protein